MVYLKIFLILSLIYQSNSFYIRNTSDKTSLNILSKSKSNHFEQKYTAKSEGQNNYKKALYDKNIDLLICSGPAGSGKTSLACEYSLEMLTKNKINKIVITRPTKSIGENLGYLPGDINEKMYPWTRPIFDLFQEYLTQSEIDYYLKEKIIEICPLGFIQGRTFKNSVIIADEMQNSCDSQMYMLLTRLGEKSKMIINGDIDQVKENNGLKDFIQKLNLKYPSELEKYNNSISFINLDNNDIQRHQIIKKIIEIYK